MTLNDEICIQLKITKETRFFFISDGVRKNIESYDKKENKKRDTKNY